ncbi:hypothetical protein EJB05_18092, partial [Eragrostis curvula]
MSHVCDVVAYVAKSAEVALLMTCLHLLVVESCTGKEAVEMPKMLAGTFREGLLDGDVLVNSEVMVESTQQVAVTIDSNMEVGVESYSEEELLVMMVEVVTCVEVVDTGKLLVGIHCCLEMVNNGVVAAECCSSMVVVKMFGAVLEISSLVGVEGSCKILVEMDSCLEALTDGKVAAKGSSFGEVMGTDKLEVKTGWKVVVNTDKATAGTCS